jgi:hypothetical protein
MILLLSATTDSELSSKIKDINQILSTDKKTPRGVILMKDVSNPPSLNKSYYYESVRGKDTLDIIVYIMPGKIPYISLSETSIKNGSEFLTYVYKFNLDGEINWAYCQNQTSKDKHIEVNGGRALISAKAIIIEINTDQENFKTAPEKIPSKITYSQYEGLMRITINELFNKLKKK